MKYPKRYISKQLLFEVVRERKFHPWDHALWILNYFELRLMHYFYNILFHTQCCSTYSDSAVAEILKCVFQSYLKTDFWVLTYAKQSSVRTSFCCLWTNHLVCPRKIERKHGVLFEKVTRYFLKKSLQFSSLQSILATILKKFYEMCY